MMTGVAKIAECGLLATLIQISAVVIMRFSGKMNSERLDNRYVFGIMRGILDSFDVEEEYAKEIENPYSWRFDEYKRVFYNEIENLSNEYTLRVRKKGFFMLFGITAALIDVNAAQSKLVLLVNFNENYSKCLRLLEEVTTARGSYYC
ncbi:hypothetical protein Tco_1547132 [Tanacetum coccineum]